MKIRDLLKMISATVGQPNAPASQQAIARGFLASHSSPYACVVIRSLSEAIGIDDHLYVCRSLADPRKYMQFGRDRSDFINLTDPNAMPLVSTRADYCGHDGGDWVTIEEALLHAGNSLEKFKAPVAI